MFFRRAKSANAQSLKKTTCRKPGLESLEARQMMHGDALDEVAYASGPLSGGDLDVLVGGTVTRIHTVPQLSSRPGSPVTLYLDFDGNFQSSFSSYDNITTPAFDRDGDPGQLSVSELDAIRQIWTSVAEDFAPFKINVTTVDPGDFSNSSKNMRIAIGGQNFLDEHASGVAQFNSFTDSDPNIGFAFDHQEDGSLYSVRKISEIVSHEAGHTFGLFHQSTYNSSGVLTDEYRDGDAQRAPIMGHSNDAERGLWMRGPSNISSYTLLSPGEGQYLIFMGARYILGQDDMARLARSANGFGYRDDDLPATFNQAMPLSVGPNQLFTGHGIIEKTTDKDTFKFETNGGYVGVNVFGAVYVSPYTYATTYVGNLDMTVELRSATGALVASANANHSQYEYIFENVAPGTYYVVVGSNGEYGDVGQYHVEVSETKGPRIVSSERGHLNDTQDVIYVKFDEPINASSFTPADVNLGSGPFAPEIISVSPRIDGEDRMFTIVYTKPTVFDVQSVTIGPNITDLLGNLMNQDGDYYNGELLEDRYIKSFQPPLAIESDVSTDLEIAAVDAIFASLGEPRRKR